MTNLSRFSADKYPGYTVVTRREKPPTGSPIRRSYAMVYQHEFATLAALGQISGSMVALLLELIRQSGLKTVMKRDSWVLFSDSNLEIIGLVDRHARHHATRRLVTLGWIETKAIPGHKLQYRLNPDWAKPKAEVVDLASRRKAKR
jgi:hypothetical protein